jgi:hypothetical protein
MTSPLINAPSPYASIILERLELTAGNRARARRPWRTEPMSLARRVQSA